MKKRVITRTVLLTVALAGTMASCQKDEFSNEMVPSQEMSLKEKAHISLTLRYWIDGVEYNQSFASKAEENAYISYLIGLTLEGREITIGGSENPSLAPEADDKLTFETEDKEAMDTWATEMKDKGYNVKYNFDKERNLYIGTATKGGSRTMAANLLERE
ncbi:MAG: hypothetical protein IKD33_07135 [Bacteroidales bacterium]|nr:hypothetical protein [Bacteroidales bacterium]